MNRFNDDSFERLLREKTDEFRLYPNRRVWSSLYNNLHPGSRWPSRAVSIGLLSLLFVLGHLNSNHHRITARTHQVAAEQKLLRSIQAERTTNARIFTTAITTEQEADAVKVSVKAKPTSHPLYQPSNSLNLNPIALRNAIRKQQAKAAVNVKRGETDWAEVNSSSVPKSVVDVVASTANVLERNIDAEATELNFTESASELAVAKESSNSISRNSELSTIKSTVTENESATYRRWRNQWSSLYPKESDLSYMDQVAERQRRKRAFRQNLSWTIWGTPSLVYRSLNYAPLPVTPVASAVVTPEPLNPEIDRSVQQQASWGFEAGAGFKFEFARRLRVSAGLQANYTRYNIEAFQNPHPVATTLTMNNYRTGTHYEVLRTTKYTNGYGMDQTTLHNQTLQASLPIGLEYRLIGKQRLQWYVGTGIQPTLLVNGKAYLISSDRRNYIEESGMLRRWNINASVETYVSYTGRNGLIWQIGPQFRRQLFSTNVRQYAVEELLNSYGIKIGVSKPLR